MVNIYLIGMMGSGKSVTGKRLAAKLGCHFIDLDELIQTRTGKSIKTIFEKDGEPFFRDQESAALKEASNLSPRVIATGGGTILRTHNVEKMKATGKIVYLETSPDTLWERVKAKKDRPLLSGDSPRETLMSLYATRRPFYESLAHFKVNTDGKTAQAVADEIYAELMKS